MLLEFCAAVLCAALPSTIAAADAPSNRMLIAAMPDGTESVLVYRYDRLMAPGSLFEKAAREYLAYLATLPDQRGATVQARLVRAVSSAGIIAHAIGGSEFGPPPGGRGIGGGVYRERHAYITGKSLSAFNRNIDEGSVLPNRTKRTVDGLTVYEFAEPAPEDVEGGVAQKAWFISFLGDFTMLMAERLEDVTHMARSLSENRREIPAQWRDLAARVDVESAAIAVLRRYDPTNERDPLSPVNPRLPKESRLDITGYAVTLPTAEKLMLRMYCRTGEPKMAPLFLRQITGTNDERWVTTDVPAGFLADLPIDDYPEPGLIFLRMPLVFGQYIAI